jgi:hypothetical protein
MTPGTPASQRASELARGAVAGGAVTRERLQAAAKRDGRDASALVRSLLAQSVPAIADLARAYDASGGILRIDPSLLSVSPQACRLLDAETMRRERCVPVEILDDLCVLAVQAGRIGPAVEAVRLALRRDVLPVLADDDAIDAALRGLRPPAGAVRLAAVPRVESPIHARFRTLVIEDEALDALPAKEAGA